MSDLDRDQLTQIDAQLEQVLAPLRVLHEQLQAHRENLRDEIAEIDSRLVRLNRTLNAADPNAVRPGPKPGSQSQSPKKSKVGAYDNWTPSQALLDVAMQAFTIAQRPLSIPELADLTGRSGASMDKVVRHLRNAEIVRAAGKVSNPDRPYIKRNVYALMSASGDNGKSKNDGDATE